MKLEHPITVGTAEFNADQHSYYEWMRREAPVYRGRLALRPPEQDVYFISRYRDCQDLVTDSRIRRVLDAATDDVSVIPEAIRLLTTDTMVYQDDPSHLRLRKLVSRPFAPRAVEGLGDRIRTVARELLDQFEPGQRIELHQQYALPAPTTVISEMVGVANKDRAEFYNFIELLFEAMLNHNAAGSGAQMDDFVAYLRDLIEQRRADPGQDIITGLLSARENDDRLTDDEIVAMVFLLITGDYQTTPNVITNGIAALLTHPDQLRLLRQHPDLIGSAVEEILRYSGTVGGTEATTFAGEDITLHGVTIPRGAMVTTLLTSANRDPAQFPDPNRFDITRTPNNHLAFSKGAHFCLGSHLARLEVRIVIGELINRFPGLTLAVDPEELCLQPIPLLNRFDEVPVILG